MIGFVLYPIAYNIPLRADAVDIGRLMGGGVAMSIVVYIVLRIGWLITRKIVGVPGSNRV